MLQPAWSEENLGNLRRGIEEFETMLMETFDGHCASGQYPLKHDLLDQKGGNCTEIWNNICFDQHAIRAF